MLLFLLLLLFSLKVNNHKTIFLSDDVMSSLNAVVRAGLGKAIKSIEKEIVTYNSKQNTPGQLQKTNVKYKRKRQIIFDAFYKI